MYGIGSIYFMEFKMKRDVNNIPVFVKELLILTPFQHLMGTLFLNVLNRLKVEGREVLKKLPDKNVLFVSNHQTYFMEGIAMMAEFDYIRQPLLHWCWKAKTISPRSAISSMPTPTPPTYSCSSRGP